MKLYAFFTTVIIAISPTLIYFLYAKPVQDLIGRQNELLIEAKQEAEKAELIQEENKKQKDELASLKELSGKQIKEIDKKNEEIKTLEEDFKKLFASGEKLNDELKKVQEQSSKIESTGTCAIVSDQKEEEKTSGIDTEYKAIDFLVGKNIGAIGAPFLKGASLPDLKTLFETTSNTKIKEILSSSCPEEYFKPGNKKFELMSLALIRGYCPGNKIENCSSELKTKIENTKNTGILKSLGHHLITRYSAGNGADYQERAFVYFNETGERICSWIGTKKGDNENFTKLK